MAAEEVFLNGQVQCLRHVLIFGALNASSGGAAMGVLLTCRRGLLAIETALILGTGSTC